MPLAQLISVDQLKQRLNRPGLRILDCRFALDNPAYGKDRYAEGHVPGAHHADLNEDLSSPVIKGFTGRHPLPSPDALSERLRQWGINQDSEIVLYDDGSDAFAARAWWTLVWLGKRDGVYLLDGGMKAWREAGGALSQSVPDYALGNFQGQPDPLLLVSAEDLKQRLGDTSLTLIDARALPRFKGEVEPLDPVAGHIPGAQCAVYLGNLDSNGRFLSPQQLRERFTGLLQGRPVSELVAYCGSGVTACHNLFSLCLAGYPLAPLYAGSWSEWVTNPERPVATGE